MNAAEAVYSIVERFAKFCIHRTAKGYALYEVSYNADGHQEIYVATASSLPGLAEKILIKPRRNPMSVPKPETFSEELLDALYEEATLMKLFYVIEHNPSDTGDGNWFIYLKAKHYRWIRSCVADSEYSLDEALRKALPEVKKAARRISGL